MIVKLQKWGNGQGLRLPKTLIQKARMDLGSEVEVSFTKGRITLKLVSEVRGRYRLRDLVAKMPKTSKSQELDWGKVVGREVW